MDEKTLNKLSQTMSTLRMYVFSLVLVFKVPSCCRFLTSTFEKPSSLSGQAQGTYLYAAQISESVLSLCRVKNGLHFLDSPCGCKE